MRVAITGANGFVGGGLCRYFRDRGYDVVALCRRAPADGVVQTRFVLGEQISQNALQGVGALVHCAWDTSLVRWSEIERTNILGSLQLLRAARSAGVESIVFISTMSAFEGCVSMYGRAKLAVEREMPAQGGIVVRPGLVYGDSGQGLMGALERVAARLPVVPLVGRGDQVLYLTQQQRLMELLEKLAHTSPGEVPNAIVAASKVPMTFRKILALLAAKHGRHPLFLPIPWQALWMALRTAELLHLRLRFRSDSLLSLINQNPRPDFSELDRLGFAFCDFA